VKEAPFAFFKTEKSHRTLFPAMQGVAIIQVASVADISSNWRGVAFGIRFGEGEKSSSMGSSRG
jgi:hypothetical protein